MLRAPKENDVKSYVPLSLSKENDVKSYVPLSLSNSDGSLNVTPASDADSSLGAMISYSASYYDAADRDVADVNVGDNGGSVWSRPESVPDRSSDVQVTSYGYDAAGNQDTTTDPNGIVTQSYFDALGRTTETIVDYTDGTPTNNSNQTTQYTYDGNDDVTSITAVMPSGTANQTTDVIYGVTTTGGCTINSNDLLAEVEYPDPSTGVAGASASDNETYTYNALGELTSITDRNGTTHTYTYDWQGNETSDTVTVVAGNPENIDTAVTELTYSYNNQRLPYQQTSYDSSGDIVNQVQDEYNGLGQLTGQYQADSGAVDTSSTPEVQYVYSDPSNGSRLMGMIYPNGRELVYGYTGNALDNAIGRVDFLAEANGTLDVAYQYLGLGTVISQAQGNGITETTILNSFGEVGEMDYVNTSTGVSTDDFQYGYDDDGNVLYEDNTVDPSLSELFTYDNLGRLTSYEQGTLNSTDSAIEGTPSQSQSWTYDALGSQLSVTTNGTTTTNAVNSQNQLIETGSGSLIYDNDGNMTTDQNGNTYIYNAWDQLVAAKNSSGTTIANYTYDANGDQITQTESGATTDFYLSSQGQVIEERQGSTAIAQNVWNIDYVNDLLQRTQATITYYLQHDANFDVMAVTDTSGDVLERYTYNPYGTVTVLNANGTVKGDGTIASSSIGIPYFFQGGRIDTATGFYHFGARDYSPETGNWIQQDPAGYVNGLNVYQPELDNPETFSDSSGLAAEQSPYLPDPTQKPPGWNPNWPTGVDNRGPYSQDPSNGTKWYPHPEDNKHWPHYDNDNGERYPKKSLKPRNDKGKRQQVKPYGDQSATNPWPQPAPPSPNQTSRNLCAVGIGIGVLGVGYEIGKWTVGILGAPETGGASLGLLLLP